LNGRPIRKENANASSLTDGDPYASTMTIVSPVPSYPDEKAFHMLYAV
jgi:hypothetical protein